MKDSIIINLTTNIGDAVLCLPVLDKMRASYPKSKITAIVSHRTKELFMRNDFVDEVIVFNKKWTIKQKIKFGLDLRGKYNIIVDLKNTLLPLIIGAKERTPFVRPFLKKLHPKDAYWEVVRNLGICENKIKKSSFNITSQEKKKWDQLNLKPSLFVGCSSLFPGKSYPYHRLKVLTYELIRKKFPIVIFGEDRDRSYYRDILSINGVVDLVGKTSLSEVFYLLNNYSKLLLSVDSSILHLGSYLNIPIVALFGLLKSFRFTPWSDKYIVLKRDDLDCQSCGKTPCQLNYECMNISEQEIIAAIEALW